MEQLILKTIDHVKHDSKRKAPLGSILQRITKPVQPIFTTKL